MRQTLSLFLKQRLPFTARVEQFGTRHAIYSGLVPTILLKDAMMYSGSLEIPIDHLWLAVGKRMARLNPRRGDQLQFHGWIREYTKFNGRTGGESFDYCVGRPSQIERIEAGDGLAFATYWGRARASRQFTSAVLDGILCTA
jgi:hypothetical protein